MKDLEFIGIGGAYNLELGGNCAFLKEKNTLIVIDCCEDATVKLFKRCTFKNINQIIVFHFYKCCRNAKCRSL